ncbi:MAG: hypothetical protein M3251_03750, partial [Thermoproteota archaeon]|nr:hypothetical protein [Thermoproteota archaeon]
TTVILSNKSMIVLPLHGARKMLGTKRRWFGLFTLGSADLKTRRSAIVLMVRLRASDLYSIVYD